MATTKVVPSAMAGAPFAMVPASLLSAVRFENFRSEDDRQHQQVGNSMRSM